MPTGRPRQAVQLSQCREEGMECRECVQKSAEKLTAICRDLSPALARQLFAVLYPEGECASMSGTFVQAVIAQTAGGARLPRRMPARELRPVATAAVVAAGVAVA